MKLKNPLYKAPITLWIENNKASIKAYFDANDTDEFITFDKIRQDNPAVADKLSDGVIHQICSEFNIDVINE